MKRNFYRIGDFKSALERAIKYGLRDIIDSVYKLGINDIQKITVVKTDNGNYNEIKIKVK